MYCLTHELLLMTFDGVQGKGGGGGVQYDSKVVIIFIYIYTPTLRSTPDFQNRNGKEEWE